MKVVELFAGVGGFRLAFEKLGHEVIWSNQWEPSTTIQHASLVYQKQFGDHSNVDITTVESIPDCDILCAGFPCQDYSVATSGAKGLEGKKGVLWWEIYRLIKDNPPKYLLLENVDRLLTSPSKLRGRDFTIMLQSLNILGYRVEWKVINAADYGFPQRRKRIYIVAYRDTLDTVLGDAFPAKRTTPWITKLPPIEQANEFGAEYGEYGIMIGGYVTNFDYYPDYDGPYSVLADVLEDNPSDEFLIDRIDRWKFYKGAKKIARTKNGFPYIYKEGAIGFPDDPSKPSRTIVTSEGGTTPSRTAHVVDSPKGLRRLTPIELERLNGFPDNHTLHDKVTNVKRAFLMGNALVVGVIERIVARLA